jgi:ribosomal 50S subunit-associated protein YjgA (DUF615 family)
VEKKMRKPRDFDSELKALSDRTKALRERRVRQLGELVEATGADMLDMETLAGVLLVAVETADAATKEGWRRRGAGFFQRKARNASGRADRVTGRPSPSDSSAASTGSEKGAA